MARRKAALQVGEELRDLIEVVLGQQLPPVALEREDRLHVGPGCAADPEVDPVAVEPAESAVLSGGPNRFELAKTLTSLGDRLRTVDQVESEQRLREAVFATAASSQGWMPAGDEDPRTGRHTEAAGGIARQDVAEAPTDAFQ